MGILVTNYSFDGQTDIYRGEVRDVYTVGENIISVATDRLFLDIILTREFPTKVK